MEGLVLAPPQESLDEVRVFEHRRVRDALSDENARWAATRADYKRRMKKRRRELCG